MTDTEAYSVFTEAAARFASREAFNYIGTAGDETVRYAKGTLRIVVRSDENDTRLCMFDMNKGNEMFLLFRNDRTKAGKKNDCFLEHHTDLFGMNMAYAIEISSFIREEIGRLRGKGRYGKDRGHIR